MNLFEKENPDCEYPFELKKVKISIPLYLYEFATRGGSKIQIAIRRMLEDNYILAHGELPMRPEESYSLVFSKYTPPAVSNGGRVTLDTLKRFMFVRSTGGLWDIHIEAAIDDSIVRAIEDGEIVVYRDKDRRFGKIGTTLFVSYPDEDHPTSGVRDYVDAVKSIPLHVTREERI